MSFSISKLLAYVTSQESAGWGASLAVHVVGALVASITLAAVPAHRPTLLGRLTATDIQIQASWTSADDPPEIVADEPRVLVTPERVEIARRTFLSAATDVSRPTPSELALAEQMMALPASKVVPRTVAEPPTMDQANRLPTTPAVERRSMPAELPPANAQTAAALAATTPQETSVGIDPQTPPELLDNRPPSYPAEAVRQRLEGMVLLRVDVTPLGRVGRLEILASSGHPILDAAAVNAVRTWRFAPATRLDRPTAATVRLPVRFSLQTP